MDVTWLAWILLFSVLSLTTWWLFRARARSRKTDFRVIAFSTVLVLISGGFIFWQSGFTPVRHDADFNSTISIIKDVEAFNAGNPPFANDRGMQEIEHEYGSGEAKNQRTKSFR